MSELTLMFAGGGTGGHIYPGIAVADCWMQHHPNPRPIFVGSGRKIETEILAKTTYIHEVVPFESPRNIIRHPFRFWKNWRKSTQLAREYLTRYQPAVVVGLGGFASYPIVREAARAKIPIILLEQNVIPGRATTFLSRWANCLCVTYNQTHQYLPKHKSIKTTGNPVRKEIIQLAQAGRNNSSPLLLIQGGSQGAQRINQAMLNYIQEFSATLVGWKIRHQTGGTLNDEIVSQLITQYMLAGVEADVRPYFSSPAELYESATFVICRAGGTTLAELHSLRLPAMIIPITNSIRNHQYVNAVHHIKYNTGSFVQEDTTVFQDQFNSNLYASLDTQPSLINESFLSDERRKPAEQAAFLVVKEIHSLLN